MCAVKYFILIFAWCMLKACAHTYVAICTHEERQSQDQGMCITLWVEPVQWRLTVLMNFILQPSENSLVPE